MQKLKLLYGIALLGSLALPAVQKMKMVLMMISLS
jgi:hypothetical protein